jgi:cytochrome c-type biogenesis protein CcmH/NrfG
VPNDPTLGEVMRRLEDVRQDLKEDFRELGTRLDSKVSMERYQLEQLARDEAIKLILERVKGIEEAREQEARTRREEAQRIADRRAADRRLIFAALIAPVLLLLLTVYLSTQGVGA